MPCCEERVAVVLIRLFYNVSSSFLLLFILFYLTFNLLAKIFHYCGTPIPQRNEDDYDFVAYSDEEEEEEKAEAEVNVDYCHDEYLERDHLGADIIRDREALEFKPSQENLQQDHEPRFREELEEEVFYTPTLGPAMLEEIEEREPKISCISSDTKFCGAFERVTSDPRKALSAKEHENVAEKNGGAHRGIEKAQMNFMRDEDFLVFEPPKSERKKIQAPGKNIIEEEIYGDTCTVGSTSKDSSEWRSSINCRDSGTDDPFSSSSRRSCPKWESYTVFQKYDEEMLFLDRISAQKLSETESLRSIQACPRSISERILHKLATKESSGVRQNPYHELEAAYVAQICLTWEALNWNYQYFQRLRGSRRDSDPGCPAYVAQQFQQFQVLLQRYVESEPYESGKRPEIYARARSSAPKLLQVPEYRDSTDDEKEGLGSRIPSSSFLLLLEESIRTFMKFLKADRKSHCQILVGFLKKNRRVAVDPTRLHFLKKMNKKKKLKLKDLRRKRGCIRKRRLKREEEMEILMALIDMKVVSRVLRMVELSEEQLSWCDNKMSKVRVGEGRLQRESSPLFFPAH